jgi:hypothetical protein
MAGAELVHCEPSNHLSIPDSSSEGESSGDRPHRRTIDNHATLEDALRESSGTMSPAVGHLSDAVSVLVQYLKQRGDPPERVVIEVKRVVRSAYRDAPFPLDPNTRRLVDHVITWAIEAYYGVR